MTAQEITILASLMEIVKSLSGWPFALLFLIIVIGPWIFAMLLMYSFRKRFNDNNLLSEKRHEEVVRMYESNVKLVEQYENTSRDMKDVVMVNTQTFSTLTDAIRHNQFCPIVRRDGGTS